MTISLFSQQDYSILSFLGYCIIAPAPHRLSALEETDPPACASISIRSRGNQFSAFYRTQKGQGFMRLFNFCLFGPGVLRKQTG